MLMLVGKISFGLNKLILLYQQKVYASPDRRRWVLCMFLCFATKPEIKIKCIVSFAVSELVLELLIIFLIIFTYS